MAAVQRPAGALKCWHKYRQAGIAAIHANAASLPKEPGETSMLPSRRQDTTCMFRLAEGSPAIGSMDALILSHDERDSSPIGARCAA